MPLKPMTMMFALIALPSCASQPSVPVRIDGAPVAQLAEPAAKPPPIWTAPCRDPVDLRGYQGLEAGPVERLWFGDRASLVDCRDRKAALQKFYDTRDAALSATK